MAEPRIFAADFDWRRGNTTTAFKAGHAVPDDAALIAAAEAVGALAPSEPPAAPAAAAPTDLA